MTNFSYEETNTGITWIDGRSIYQRSFRWNNPASFGVGDHDTGFIFEGNVGIIDSITNIKTIISHDEYIHYLNYASSTYDGHFITSWEHPQGNLIPNTAIITVWYVKTSDLNI